MSDAQILELITSRDKDKATKLDSIQNKTSEQLAKIAKEYAVSIESSRGFGYIAFSKKYFTYTVVHKTFKIEINQSSRILTI